MMQRKRSVLLHSHRAVRTRIRGDLRRSQPAWNRSRIRQFSAATTTNVIDTDVLIVGGGVVGGSVACQLGRQAPHLRVALAEARGGPTTQPPKTPNPRSYALSPASLEWLQLENNAKDRLGYYTSMQVWEAGHPASVIFSAHEDLQAPHLGAVVEDLVIVQHLWNTLRKSNCHLLTHATLSSLELPDQATSGLATVELQQSSQDGDKAETVTRVNAQLVIGADGGNSAVRRLSGIPRKVLDYEQHALTFTVKLAGDHHQRAFQRFVGGPVALLPTYLPDHAIVVWSTSPEMAQQWKHADPDALVQHMNTLLQQGPGNVKPLVSDTKGWPAPLANLSYGAEKLLELAQVGPALLAQEQQNAAKFSLPPLIQGVVSPRFTFPLSCAQVERYTQPRLALAGDAAHTVHPMAGQGLNLGLQDARNLVQVVVQAHAAGMDVSLLLDQYETARQLQVSATLAGIHALQRLFATNQFTAMQHVKSAGMNVIQNLAPLRRQLAQAACHGVSIPI